MGCGGHDVAELERAVCLLGCNQATDVSHVTHQQRAVVISDLAESDLSSRQRRATWRENVSLTQSSPTRERMRNRHR